MFRIVKWHFQRGVWEMKEEEKKKMMVVMFDGDVQNCTVALKSFEIWRTRRRRKRGSGWVIMGDRSCCGSEMSLLSCVEEFEKWRRRRSWWVMDGWWVIMLWFRNVVQLHVGVWEMKKKQKIIMSDGWWVIFVIEEVALRKEHDPHGDVDARNCRVALRSLTNE